MSRRGVIEYVALSLIWGASFLLLVEVVKSFGWIGAVTFRGFAASGVLVLVALMIRRPLRFQGQWRHFAVVGATTVAGQLVCLSYATPRIGTAMAAIIVATIPLFSMLIGQALGIEHVQSLGRIGLGLGFVGIVLLVGFPEFELTGEFLLNCTISLTGACFAAVGSLYAQAKMQTVGSWEQTIGAFFFGGLFTFPLLLVVPLPQVPELADVGKLIALAALCSALTYVMYFRLVADVGATIAVSVEFMVTVVAVAIGAFILRESLTGIQLLGGAAIIAGCLMVLGLVPRRFRAETKDDIR